MNPQTSQDNREQGLAALKAGRFHEAATLLEAAARESPDDPRLWLGLGTAYWQMGNREKGLDAFSKAVALAPSNAAAHYNYGIALAQNQQRDEALHELNLALLNDPGHAGAQRLLNKLDSEGPGEPVAPASSRVALLLNPDALDTADSDISAISQPRSAESPFSSSPYGLSSPNHAPSNSRVHPGNASPSHETGLPDFNQMPWVALAILAINALIFWLMERAGGSTDRDVMIAYGAQFRPLVLKGEVWRLVTAMFIHAGNMHIMGNMFFFLLSARWVEPFYGRLRFLLLYMAAGLVGNFMTLLLMGVPTAGASGAVMGVIGARVVMGFQHRSSIPENLRRKFGVWPLLFGSWIIYNGIGSPQVNNVAHVAGFITGVVMALLFAPEHDLNPELPSVPVKAMGWATALLCLYTVVGMGWSVYKGVDESKEIAFARRKLAQGKIAVHLTRYYDPDLNFRLNVPKDWDRQDHTNGDMRAHRWGSPMADANIVILTVPVPKGQGGLQAFGIERLLTETADPEIGKVRILSQDRRLLSGLVGGRIVQEGSYDTNNPQLVYNYFVPVNDILYLLRCTVDKYHSPKYAPVFDTIAASFKAD